MRSQLNYNKLRGLDVNHRCLYCGNLLSPYKKVCDCKHGVAKCFICKIPISPFNIHGVSAIGGLIYHPGCLGLFKLRICECGFLRSPFSGSHHRCMIPIGCGYCGDRITSYSTKSHGSFCSVWCFRNSFKKTREFLFNGK